MKSEMLNLGNARIGFKNFAGVEGPYNKRGDRNFAVFLDNEQAQELESQGWNIKWPKPNADISTEEDTRQPHLPVSISFDYYPPKVVFVSNGNLTVVNEDEIDSLDYAEYSNIDLVLRPYNWSVNGKSGIKAYVKAMYVTLETDAFSSKYGI